MWLSRNITSKFLNLKGFLQQSGTPAHGVNEQFRLHLSRTFTANSKAKSQVETPPLDNIYHIKIGTGPHVVAILPGLFGSIETDYQLLLPKLNKEQFTWIAWDPPGYGNSRPPSRDFSGDFVRRDAHTFVKLMDSLGYDTFSAIGWSMGGMTAAVIAIDFPERLDKLIVWGSHSRADIQSVHFGNSVRTIDGWSDQIRKVLLRIYGKTYLEKMCNDWSDANEKSLKEFGCGDSAYEHLHLNIPIITAQTLIMYGEKDPMIGIEHAHYYHKNIRNSKFYLWPKATHNLHLKHPIKFLSIVEHFLLTGDLLNEEEP